MNLGSDADASPKAPGFLLLRSLLCLLLSCQGACAQLQPRPELPPELAIRPGHDAPFDRAMQELEAQRPGQSAFRLVTAGTEAFAIRAQSARTAVRSLDVQTYIWHADLTGLFLAQALIEAADRQVKVRLLLDDMDARAKNAGFAALSAHPNIEVRMFNPFASREGKLQLASEALRNFARINHRMHNKTWIADNRLAIAGGRNIGNEYFGASEEVNFVDLDFAMVGPAVRDASASFDAYWNSPSAYPIELLEGQGVSAANLDKLRTALVANAHEAEASKYGAALRADDSVRRLVSGDWPMQWTSSYRFIADDPLKVTMTTRDVERAQVGAALVPTVRSARDQLTIISPYFVPGEELTVALAGMARSGKAVRVLTNSLVANDVAAVHGGYSRYRKPLLQGNVQDLRPARLARHTARWWDAVERWHRDLRFRSQGFDRETLPGVAHPDAAPGRAIVIAGGDCRTMGKPVICPKYGLPNER
jgi:putative cardiolipin synthase